MKIRDRIKELRRVPASELLPNPKNWRTHPTAQRDAMQGILAEVGYADAVLAYETPEGLRLVDGHLRAEVTPDAEIPVLVLDVNDEEADKILATHDPLAALAESNEDALASLVESLDFDSDALGGMISDLVPTEDPEIIEDEVPEVPVDPITKPGDLWLLGDHRLLCGDSTKAEDVERLVGDQVPPLLLITDPPYSSGGRQDGTKRNSTSIGSRSNKQIARDNLTTKGYTALLRTVIQTIATIETAYVFTDWRMWTWTYDVLESSGMPVRGMIVWDKETMGMGFPWRSQHELIAFAKCGPAKLMDGKHGNVIRSARTGNINHETEKPVDLLSCLISNSEAANVYDPFIGSGTTIIAAEQLNRRCYAMEISPQYCDVAVTRWENLTGEKAKRQKVKSNGKKTTTN